MKKRWNLAADTNYKRDNDVTLGKMLSHNLILLACTAALARAACSDYKFCEECLNEDCSFAPDAGQCLDSCDMIADTACFAPPEGFFGDDAEEICGNDLDLTDLMGDLAAGNITDALGSLVSDETEAEATGMLDGLGGLLGGLDLGNMTEADLGGILGDLGLGNMTDADLDGLMGSLSGMENMTEADLAGVLGGMLVMKSAPTMAPTVILEESGSVVKFTTTVAAWTFVGSYVAYALV